MMAASKPVAPLALSAVKLRYPHLFREYALLSDRERESTADVEDDRARPAAVDAATGLRTTIAHTDFAAPLEDEDGCPMAADSDAYQFSAFLFRMLEASESGSVGDDARRQFDVLNGALDDVLTMKHLSLASRLSAMFQHLLGWTAAAAHHGMGALLSRGDPDRNRSLFKAAGDEWKWVFERTIAAAASKSDRSETGGVSEELRDFAVYMCETLQAMLKEAREEYGEHARYTFSFIRKPRVQNGSGARGDSNTLATAATASSPASSDILGWIAHQKVVTVVVTKPSKDAKLGLGIAIQKGAKNIKVTSISPKSLFVGTDLKVGMLLITINGKNYSSFTEGCALMRALVGRVTIVAADPTSVIAPAGVSSPVTSASTTASTAVGRSSNLLENSVPAKIIPSGSQTKSQ